MEILNWIYLVKNKLVKQQVQSQDDLVILGTNVGFEKKGDKYQSYGMKISDFAQAIAPAGDTIGYYTVDLAVDETVNITTNKGIIKVLNANSIFTSALGPFATQAQIKLSHPDIITGDECYVQFTCAYAGGLIKDTAMPYIRGVSVMLGAYILNIYDMAAVNPTNTNQFKSTFLIYYELQNIS